MSDLDTRIRAMVGELVDAAPIAPPYAGVARPEPPSPRPRRRATFAFVGGTVAVAAAVFGLVADQQAAPRVQVGQEPTASPSGRVPDSTAVLLPAVQSPTHPSSGAQREVAVPDVAGLSVPAARAALSHLGLTIVTKDDSAQGRAQTDAADWYVVTQNPPAGVRVLTDALERAIFDEQYKLLDQQRAALENQLDAANMQIAPLVPFIVRGRPHPAEYDTLETEIQDLGRQLGDTQASIVTLIAQGPETHSVTLWVLRNGEHP